MRPGDPNLEPQDASNKISLCVAVDKVTSICRSGLLALLLFWAFFHAGRFLRCIILLEFNHAQRNFQIVPGILKLQTSSAPGNLAMTR